MKQNKNSREKGERHTSPGSFNISMALFFNFFSCFSESSEASAHTCEGGVCRLSDRKIHGQTSKKKKQHRACVWNSFPGFLMKRG
uniref:Uncharacterized protein n=1 Tax=Vitis vinifera TaxID=29760 RepID=F6HEP5_VITVI